MERILLTTGGTGGHIFPALAVAEELRRQNSDVALLFVGSLYGPEQRLAALAQVPFAGLPVRGFLGRGLRTFGAGGRMLWAVGKALGLVRRFQPQAVAGFGGYAAFAPLLAARLCGIPGILHEQNALAGTSNLVLSRLVQRVCLSMPGTEGFAPQKCVLTGNPVRQAVSDVALRPRQWSTRRLLIMGGSQGARALNRALPEVLPKLKAAQVEIRHQSGAADEASTREAYAKAGYDPQCVTAFVDDMASAYAWADLALCRAGASTVAELCAVGLPSVLVPFPQAAHDHQSRNAAILEKTGAALLLPESQMRQESLGDTLLDLLNNAEHRAAMSKAALAAAVPDAAARVVAALASVVKGAPKKENHTH